MEHCKHCNSKNINKLDNDFECYDCGEISTVVKPVKNEREDKQNYRIGHNHLFYKHLSTRCKIVKLLSNRFLV